MKMSSSQRPEGSQHSSSSQQTSGGYATSEQRLKYISDCNFLNMKLFEILSTYSLFSR